MSCSCPGEATAPIYSIHKVYDNPRRYTGKCRHCGRPLSILAARAALVVDGHHTTGYVDERGRTWKQGRNTLMPVVVCPCGAQATLMEVAGTFDPGKECNARCMASTGPSCECRCAGLNHGAGNGF